MWYLLNKIHVADNSNSDFKPMNRSYKMSQLGIYTTGKKYGIFFHFKDFLYFVGGVRYFLIWLTFLQTDITFGELIHTQ